MGDQLVISVDADRGMVTTHGWQERSSVSAVRFASYLQEEGIKHILYTDIDRDGMMMGMNLESISELAEAVDIDIIASGGISSLDDLKRLKALGSAQHLQRHRRARPLRGPLHRQRSPRHPRLTRYTECGNKQWQGDTILAGLWLREASLPVDKASSH